MSVEIQRRLSAIMQRNREDQKSLVVTVHPDVMQRLRTEDGELLVGLERKYQARLTFRTDANFTREQFSVANAANNEEIRN